MALLEEFSPEALGLILNRYLFEEVSSSSIKQLTDGWTNLTFKFQMKSTENFYVLRIYRPSTERRVVFEDIHFELNFISYLFKHHHLSVVPMIDPPGIFLYNNKHYCAIFPFIDGIKYVNTPEYPLQQLWQTIEISRFLGHMHSIDQQKISSSFNRRVIPIVDTKYQLVNSCNEFQREYADLYRRIRQILDEHTNSVPLIENELEQIIFEKTLEENLHKGFIHVDIHDDNVLFLS